MSTSQETIEQIFEQIHPTFDLRYRKMFGEYAIYFQDKVVAFVCDNKLFIKINEESSKIIRNPQTDIPYPNAKPYYLVDKKEWSDAQYITELFSKTSLGVTSKIKNHKN